MSDTASSPPTTTLHSQQLETDLSYRLQYLTQLIGFSHEDIVLIHQSTPILAPLIPTVTELVYDQLFSFSVTKHVFAEYALKKPFTLLEGKGLDHRKGEQLKFRKDMLGRYLVKLVTCDYENINFLKYLDYVGKLHTSKAGNQNIVVDYIHCNALFGFVSDIITNAIMEAPKLTFSTKCKTVRAFNKLLWIQNDLFSRHYQQQDFSIVNGLEKNDTVSKSLEPSVSSMNDSSSSSTLDKIDESSRVVLDVPNGNSQNEPSPSSSSSLTPVTTTLTTVSPLSNASNSLNLSNLS